MRIAHVITRMIVGGAQENTLFSCLDLMRIHNHEVLLVTGPALGPEGDLLAQGKADDLPVRYVQPLRRAIQRYVEDPLSERLLWKEFRAGEKIIVDVEPDPDNPGELQIAFSSVEGFEPPPVEELASAE